MKKFKNIFLSLLTAILVIAPAVKVSAEEPINFYLFYSSSCSHCEDALAYLNSMDETERSKFNLIKFEVSSDSGNSNLMTTVANKMGDYTSTFGVPYMIIGNQTLVGYGAGYSEDLITAAVDEAYTATDRYDLANHVDLSTGTASADSDAAISSSDSSSDIKTLIALGVIVIGVVGLIVFAKIKTK